VPGPLEIGHLLMKLVQQDSLDICFPMIYPTCGRLLIRVAAAEAKTFGADRFVLRTRAYRQ
jgi:hypothetical protein